jgi:hypothetical protein
MSDEKNVKAEKIADKTKDLEKQVANIAFTVRKIKNKLEEQLGMDIDGDGRVGSGPFKKALAFLLVAGMASFCTAEDKTAIGYWSTHAYVNSNGNFAGDGASLTNIGASSISSDVITNVLTAGMVLPAVDGSAITNMSAAQLAAGTVLLAVSGLAVTNISAANLKAGTVASAISGASITNIGAANIAAGGTFGAINGSALTALTAANITTTGTKYTGKVTIVSTISTTVLDFITGLCTNAVTTP